jgi:hypothetical protein
MAVVCWKLWFFFEGQRRNLIDVNAEQSCGRNVEWAGGEGGGLMKGLKKDKRIIAG